MGIYDRDYYQEKPPGFAFGGPRMMVTNLVLVNVAVYLAQLLFDGRTSITDLFELHGDLFTHPWQFYQLLTYGFLHSPKDVWHIIGNMAILWFLGREVEQLYGQREFLTFYLSTIILSGLAWVVLENLVPGGQASSVIGASGGVCGVAIVFVMHYPRRMLYLFFLIPVPIWVVAVCYLGWDTFNSVLSDGKVASSAHLAGAALGYLYYRTRWQLGNYLPSTWPPRWLRGRSRMRIHQPKDEDDDDQLKAEVDRILEKISRSGEASLSSRERATLEDASRRYQRRGR